MNILFLLIFDNNFVSNYRQYFVVLLISALQCFDCHALCLADKWGIPSSLPDLWITACETYPYSGSNFYSMWFHTSYLKSNLMNYQKIFIMLLTDILLYKFEKNIGLAVLCYDKTDTNFFLCFNFPLIPIPVS
jgi:hypothetical protein